MDLDKWIPFTLTAIPIFYYLVHRLAVKLARVEQQGYTPGRYYHTNPRPKTNPPRGGSGLMPPVNRICTYCRSKQPYQSVTCDRCGGPR